MLKLRKELEEIQPFQTSNGDEFVSSDLLQHVHNEDSPSAISKTIIPRVQT